MNDSKELTLKEDASIKYIVTAAGCHECISYHAKHSFGYTMINRNGKVQILPRYVYTLMNGDIPKKMCIRHSCDNPKYINPSHLSMGTIADNNQDKKERDRERWGENHHNAKLTNAQVIAILSDTRRGIDIAKAYNIAKQTVCNIQKGRVRKRLK